MEYKISKKVCVLCNGYMNTATIDAFVDEFIKCDKSLLIQVEIYDSRTKKWEKFNSRDTLICGNFIVSPEHDNSDFLRLKDVKLPNGSKLEFQTIEINDEFIDTLRTNLQHKVQDDKLEMLLSYYGQFVLEPIQTIRNPITGEIIKQYRPNKSNNPTQKKGERQSSTENKQIKFGPKKYIGPYLRDRFYTTKAYETYSENGAHWVIVEYVNEYVEPPKVEDRVIMPYELYEFDMYMENIDDTNHEEEAYYAMIDGDEDEYPEYYPGAFDDFFR